ncbi:MAG: polysaccharide deacetylase family protein [Pseudomonadota bacterium]
MGAGARAGATGPYHPPAGDPLAWPANFGTRFVVFVDTEEEFDWNAPFSRTAHGVSATSAIPAAHARFADRGVALTWLVDYPIVSDPASVDRIAATLTDGRSAVGTQLHPWVNPPFDEPLSPRNSFVGNLPETLEAAKLEVLTDAIAAAFGARPVVYRAGRYGIGPATLRLLAERGYQLDSSVRARYDYMGEGGPDFTLIGNDAYRATEGPVELPLTTAFIGRLRSPALYRALTRVPKGRGAFARAGLLSRIALTPESMPLDEVLEAIRVVHGEGLRLLNFAFHSPSLVPGHTPYVRDAGDLAKFWAWWDGVLNLLAQLGIANASLDEVLAASTP